MHVVQQRIRKSWCEEIKKKENRGTTITATNHMYMQSNSVQFEVKKNLNSNEGKKLNWELLTELQAPTTSIPIPIPIEQDHLNCAHKCTKKHLEKLNMHTLV